jgi:hypothetical protein
MSGTSVRVAARITSGTAAAPDSLPDIYG